MRAAHSAAEDGAPAGIVAQVFEEEACDTVYEHEGANDLSIEFPAFQQPHQEEEVRKFNGAFEELRGLEGNSQRSSSYGVGQRIVECDGPPMMSRLTVAASGGEASEAPQSVTESKARGKSIDSAESRHMIFAHVPSGGNEGGEQASRENSSRLQSVDAEDLADMAGVIAPLVDDVENLGAQDAAQNDENAQVPSLVGVIAEAFCVADTDPKPEQDSKGNEESVGREEETSDMKKLWEHSLVRCGNRGFAT